MNYNYFKDKYIDEINIEELEWIKNNSYINNYPYYGQKIILSQKVSYDNVEKKFPEIIHKIKSAHSAFKKTNEIREANIVAKYIQILYLEISHNTESFLADEGFLKDFISLYHLIRDIENELYKKFDSHVRWRLWHEHLVRSTDINEHDYLVMRWSIPHAEHGDYEKAASFFDSYETQRNFLPEAYKKSHNLQISWLFYKQKFDFLSGNSSESTIKELIDLDKKTNGIFEEFWMLTKLKVSELFLESYIYFKKDEYLDFYKQWLTKALSQFRDTNNFQSIPYGMKIDNSIFDVNTNNIEAIREPLLNLAMYYYIMFDKA